VLACYAVWDLWVNGEIFSPVKDHLGVLQLQALNNDESPPHNTRWNSVKLFFFKAWLCDHCFAVHAVAYAGVLFYLVLPSLAGATLAKGGLFVLGAIGALLLVRRFTTDNPSLILKPPAEPDEASEKAA